MVWNRNLEKGKSLMQSETMFENLRENPVTFAISLLFNFYVCMDCLQLKIILRQGVSRASRNLAVPGT
jgi:hypothetical protein